MNMIAEPELAEIARNAASNIAGLGAVERVNVKVGLDSTDRLAYYFSFLIDRGSDHRNIALPLTRLSQKLRDELIARDDDHYPYVQVLNRADWETLESA